MHNDCTKTHEETAFCKTAEERRTGSPSCQAAGREQPADGAAGGVPCGVRVIAADPRGGDGGSDCRADSLRLDRPASALCRRVQRGTAGGDRADRGRGSAASGGRSPAEAVAQGPADHGSRDAAAGVRGRVLGPAAAGTAAASCSGRVGRAADGVGIARRAALWRHHFAGHQSAGAA